nr:alpha/beta hydrolase [Comamonas sp. PE63]
MVWHGWQPPAGVAQRGLPLVLLHGGSGSWTHWLRVIEPLTEAGYSLWLADLPGFGESDGVPGGMDVDTMLEPLACGIRQLLGNADMGPVCDLVGFSFGGMTAGLLAAEHPELARRLVVVGAPGMGMTEGRSVRLLGWRHLQGQEAQMQAHRHNIAALMLHDAALIDEETLALHALNVARDRLPRRRLSRTDVLARALTRIKVPVAAIYGEHDPLYAGCLAELQLLMQRQCGGALDWHVMRNVGHWVQHEDPATFCAALQEALS